MIQIIPLASAIHEPEQIQRCQSEISNRLQQQGIPHLLLDSTASPDTKEPLALLVLTGGTEAMALDIIRARTSAASAFQSKQLERADPVLLLAHPFQNSFPACLEVLARLRQMNRRGKIVMLNDDPSGYSELQLAASALNARRRLHGSRLGVIGAPSPWLIASAPDSKLVDEYWQLEMTDIPIDEVIEASRGLRMAEIDIFLEDLLERNEGQTELLPSDLESAAKIAVALRHIAEWHHLDALTVRCFDFVKKLKTTGCLALSHLLDQGIVAGCEGDIASTITMLWMQVLTGEVPFMGNPQDLDCQNNTLWLCHCTIARSLIDSYTLRSHFESSLGVALNGRVPQSPITLARVGGVNLSEVFISSGEIVANGTSELRCRTQLQIKLDQDVRYFLNRPLGNHHVMIRGQWGNLLQAYADLFLHPAARGAKTGSQALMR